MSLVLIHKYKKKQVKTNQKFNKIKMDKLYRCLHKSCLNEMIKKAKQKTRCNKTELKMHVKKN